jgi:hypothetical protein
MSGAAIHMRRRGVALLLALAALIIATTASLTLATAAATRNLHARTMHAEELAESIARTSEMHTLSWLTEHAAAAVVPPDAPEPVVSVLHDRFSIDGVEITVRITAFDQLGMVPAIVADRFDLPTNFESTAATKLTGLDQLVGTIEGDVFPHHDPATASVIFGFAIRDASDRIPVPEQTVAAMGSLVSTHGYENADGQVPTMQLNINTAPLALVDEVLSRTGIDASGPIKSAREQGEQARPPASSIEIGDLRIRLLARSDCWAVRTDVTVDRVRYAHWSIYQARGQGWELEQRLVIAE